MVNGEDLLSTSSSINIYNYFVQLDFNLSNGVTDTLESNSILIYFTKQMSLYTQNVGRTQQCLNCWLKVNEGEKQEMQIKNAVAEEISEWIYNKIFFANAKIIFSEDLKSFFYNFNRWSIPTLQMTWRGLESPTRRQCYKTFFFHNLLMFVIS